MVSVYEMLGIALVVFSTGFTACTLLWLAWLGVKEVVGRPPVQTPQEIADVVVTEDRLFRNIPR